jgi:hypothetical protein
MNILRLTALGTLALTLHLQAQTPAPAPPPPPASGPTMEQTIAFINGALTKQGELRYVWANALDQDDSIIANQHMAQTRPCELTFKFTEIKCTICGRHRGDHNSEMYTNEATEVLRLDIADPLTILVRKMNSEPQVYVPTVQQPKNGDVQSTDLDPKPDLGYFTSEDVANRVAKAYIHAIILCHKPEAPSLF